MERQLCDCKCGDYAKLNHKGKPNKYIRGHARKGKTKYPEQFETPPLCKCPCEKPVKWNKGKKRWNTYLTGHNNRTYKEIPKQSKYPPLCKCGCGQEVKWNNSKKRWNVYLSGHNVRGKPRPNKGKSKYDDSEQVPTLCECGCGEFVKWVNGKPNKFASSGCSQRGKKLPPYSQERRNNIGDANRGKKRTQKQKDNVSEKITKKWEDPKYKEDVLAGHDRHWTEERKQEKSIQTIERFEDPKEREKTSLGVKKYYEENEAVHGPDHWSWKGGITNKDYCCSWSDKEYKQDIRDRDNNKCQNPKCWGTINLKYALDLHHINYNKLDCRPINLISLCKSCHSRANTKRDFWQKFYEDIMKEK